MSFNFEINHEDVFQGDGPIPIGTYEVVVREIEEKLSGKNNRKNISIQLAVRNDIAQKYGNKIIFDTIWTAKEDNETYNMKNINTLAKALRVPNGKKYTSMAELLGDFKGKTALITVKHEIYNGDTQVRVSKWEESKYPECHHVFKAKEDGAATVKSFEDMTPVDDGDIPF